MANVLFCKFVQFDGQAAAASGCMPFVASGGVRVQKKSILNHLRMHCISAAIYDGSEESVHIGIGMRYMTDYFVRQYRVVLNITRQKVSQKSALSSFGNRSGKMCHRMPRRTYC